MLPHVMLAGVLLVVLAVPLGRYWPPADIAAQFLLQALGLAGIATALALARGQRGAALVGLASIGLALTILQPFGRGVGAEAAGPELRVLFANLHRPGGDLPVAVLEERLAASGADVVLLAELADPLMRDLARPARRFPYVVDCRGQRHCETAILAARPLRAASYDVDAREGGRVLVAELTVAGVSVTVAVTHILRPIPPGNQARNLVQAQFVADRLRTVDRLILGGDFNGVPWARVMGFLQATLGVEGRLPWGGTWPAWLPPGLRLPIDHVLAGCGMHVVRNQTLRFAGSDHLAVLATVRFDPGARCARSDLGGSA